MEDNKILLIELLEAIRENTDSDHAITQVELERLLGLERSKRKTTANYLRMLCDSGLIGRNAISREDGTEYTLGYYAEPEFNIGEIQQLIFHVLSTKNLTTSEKNKLIPKLRRLAGVSAKIQTDGVEAYESFKKIALPRPLTDAEAAKLNKKLDAIYWSIEKKEKLSVLTVDGCEMIVEPYTLVLKNDSWYLICIDHDDTVVIPVVDIAKTDNIAEQAKVDDSAIYTRLNMKNQRVNRYLEMNPDMENGTIVLATVWMNDNGVNAARKYFGDTVITPKENTLESVYESGYLYEINAVDTCIERFALANLGNVHILYPEFMRRNFVKRVSDAQMNLQQSTKKLALTPAAGFSLFEHNSNVLWLNGSFEDQTEEMRVRVRSLCSKLSCDTDKYRFSVLPGAHIDEKTGEPISCSGMFDRAFATFKGYWDIREENQRIAFGVLFAEVRRTGVDPYETPEERRANRSIFVAGNQADLSRIMPENICKLERFCKEENCNISLVEAEDGKVYLIIYGGTSSGYADPDENSNDARVPIGYSSVRFNLQYKLRYAADILRIKVRYRFFCSVNNIGLRRLPAFDGRLINNDFVALSYRRGAVSAYLDESVIVSGIDAKSGCYEYVVGKGVGNMDWNFSLPSHCDDLEGIMNQIDSPLRLREVINVGGHRRA